MNTMFERDKVLIQLEQQIANNEVGQKYRLPSERELAARYGCSRVTIRAALNHFDERNMLARVPGKGTFLLTPPQGRQSRSKPSCLTHVAIVVINQTLTGGNSWLLAGVRDKLSPKEFAPSNWVFSSDGDGPKIEECTEALREFDGYIIAGDYCSADLLWFTRQRKPMVVVGQMGDDILRDLAGSYRQVGHENGRDYERAMELLWSRGYRRPAFLGTCGHSYNQSRRAGFRDSLKRFGQNPDDFVCMTVNPDDLHDTKDSTLVEHKIAELMDQRDRFDSLVTVFRHEVLMYCRSKGIGIPKNFGFIAESAGINSELELLEITELQKNKYLMGQLAAEELIDHSQSKDKAQRFISVPSTLILRASTPQIKVDSKS